MAKSIIGDIRRSSALWRLELEEARAAIVKRRESASRVQSAAGAAFRTREAELLPPIQERLRELERATSAPLIEFTELLGSRVEQRRSVEPEGYGSTRHSDGSLVTVTFNATVIITTRGEFDRVRFDRTRFDDGGAASIVEERRLVAEAAAEAAKELRELKAVPLALPAPVKISKFLASGQGTMTEYEFGQLLKAHSWEDTPEYEF